MATTHNNVFVLGCRASGKTSFLTGLSILSRPGHSSPFSMVVNDERTAGFVTDLKRMADQGEWPPATANMVPLDFEVIFKSRSFLVSLLDYPGEDLLHAMETMDYENRELIEQHILSSDVILVLLDPTQDFISPLNSNPLPLTQRRQDALAMAIGKLASIRAKAGEPAPIIALVVTKADLLKEGQFVDAKARNRTLIKKIAHYARSPQLRLFPISACGPLSPLSPPDVRAEVPASYPVTPAPSGFEDLFEWLGERMDFRRHERKILGLVSAVAVALLIACLVFVSRRTTVANLAKEVETANVSRLTEIVSRSSLPFRIQEALDGRGQRELQRFQADLANARFSEEVSDLAKELREWAHMPHLSHRASFQALFTNARDREEDKLVRVIQTAHETGDQARTIDLIRDYSSRFPTGGQYSEEVERIRREVLTSASAQLRNAIKQMPITGRDSLHKKNERIAEYLTRFPFDPDRQQMRVAQDVAARLASADRVRIVLVSCRFEGMSPRRHEVRWQLGDTLQPSATHESDGKSDRSTARQHRLDVPSSQWPNVRVMLYATNWRRSMTLISERQIRLLRDLMLFDGGTDIEFTTRDSNWDEVRSWFRAEVHVPASGQGGFDKLSREQLNAYAEYINPGDRW